MAGSNQAGSLCPFGVCADGGVFFLRVLFSCGFKGKPKDTHNFGVSKTDQMLLVT